jgi:hypothetical protein
MLNLIQIILSLITLGQTVLWGDTVKSPLITVEKIPLEINLLQTERTPFYYSARDADGNFKFDVRNFWPITYDGRTLDELNLSWFRPGHGTMVTDTERHGNILAICHSGTMDQIPLECEEWRRIFEPYNDFWIEHFPTPEEEAARNEMRVQNMLSVIDWRVRILQGNAPEQIFRVAGVSYIPHELVPEFRADTKSVMDFLLENAVDPKPWQSAIDSEKQYLILVFCSWGPYTQETESDWNMWGRFGILLEPVD